MRSIGEFLTVIQMDDGAILNHRILTYSQTKMVPYFSCTAAEGFLASGNESYYPRVKKFCEWYFNHLNRGVDENTLDGTIFDYYYQLISNNYDITTKKERDSEDSYAALFISLLKNYADITNDFDFLIAHRDDIDLIMSVLTSPKLLNNGLTYAKTSYEIKYTMDNSEVYSGFIAAEWIYRNVFNDNIKGDIFANHANVLSETFEKLLWKEEKQAYLYHANQNLDNIDLTKFYPQGVVQLTSQMFNLIKPDGNRSQYLYKRFIETFPKWATLEENTHPWGFAGRSLSMGHIWEPVEKWLDNVKEKYVNTGFRSGGFYSAEIGHTMIILKNIIDCKKCKFSN